MTMPNKNCHIITVDYDVATNQHGDPLEVTVNAEAFFHVSDPETLQQTLALLKSKGVKSLGDFVDLVLRLSERSKFDDKHPVYSMKTRSAPVPCPKKKASFKAPIPADALMKVAPKAKLFPQGESVVFDEASDLKMFENKLGSPQQFVDEFTGFSCEEAHRRHHPRL